MFVGLQRLLEKLFGRSSTKAKNPFNDKMGGPVDAKEPTEKSLDYENANDELVAFDENFLEKSRTQWQFGDWESLTKIDRATLQHHPDRQKLALLAAAGRLQLNMREDASQFLQLALDWGANRRLVTQILCSGVHNSLACAAALAGRHEKAELNFKSAIAIGAGGADIDLLLKARVLEQTKRLQLSAQDTVKLTGHIGVSESTGHVIRGKVENNSVGDLRDVGEEITKLHNNHQSLKRVHQYWANSEQKPDDYVNADPTRSRRLVELVANYVPLEGAILEVGSNAGRNLYHLHQAGFKNLSGIEISRAAINLMRSNYPELQNVSIRIGPVEEFIESYPDRRFDCVFTMAVFEHIHNESSWIFRHIARIAKLVITIEDELRDGPRHFARNYERVFTTYGMHQVHLEGREKFNLPTGFSARVFVHKKEKRPGKTRSGPGCLDSISADLIK